MKSKKQKVTYMMKDGRAISIVQDHEPISIVASKAIRKYINME